MFVMIIFLCGCAAPDFYRVSPGAEKFDYADDVAPITEQRLSSSVVVHDDLDRVPDLSVSVQLYESISVADFFSMISDAYDLSLIVSVSTRDMLLTVPRYQGSLRGLLSALQNSHGLFFEFVSGSIIVKNQSVCSIKMMYQEDAEALSALVSGVFGAQKVHIDKINSSVVFLSNSDSYRSALAYFRDSPSTMVHLDIAFLEYELSSESDIGLDPQKIRLALDRTVSAAGQLTVSGVSGLTFSVAEGAVSLSAVISSLEKYTRYHTLQRVDVGGLSGKSLTIDVSNKISYISEVTTQAGQSGPVTRGYKFDETSSGLVLTIDINSSGDSILLKNNLRYQDVQSYVEVGSGEDKFSRPITSARNVQSYVSIRPGSVVQIARVRYKKQVDSTSGLYRLSGMLRGKQERNYEIVVLVRGILKRYYR